MKATHYLIPALLLAAACQRMEAPIQPEAVVSDDAVSTLTLQASKGESRTKALDLVSGTPDYLDAYWKGTETVKVYKGGTLLGTLDVTPASGEKPTSATLSGTIVTDGLSVNDVLTLMIPRESWSYIGQNGQLTGTDSIEDAYDYATAQVTVSAMEAGLVTTSGSAHFTNEQSIYRFGFKDGGNYIDPKSFTVSSSGGKLVQSLSWSADTWTPAYGDITVTPVAAAGDHFYYVSLRNEHTDADTYNFLITASDESLLMATQAIPAGALATPGQFISAKNVSIVKPSFAPVSGSVSEPENVL